MLPAQDLIRNRKIPPCLTWHAQAPLRSGAAVTAHCRCHSGVGQNDPVPPASVLAFRVAAMTDATLRFCTTPFIMAPWNSLAPYKELHLSDNGTHGRPVSMASAIRPYAARLCRQVRPRRLCLESQAVWEALSLICFVRDLAPKMALLG